MRDCYDVIVVGGGGAGVMAAVAAAEAGGRVAIVCKEPVGYGNSRMAVGLTACAGLPGDSRDTFVDDVLASGDGLCNPELVEALVDGSREALARLEEFGHTFNRDDAGMFSESVISIAGGHTRARTMASSGAGIGMAQSLRAAVEKHHISLYEDALALSFSKAEDSVNGVSVFSLIDGDEFILGAKAVVLATGGGGWLFYPQTSNNRGTVGDGYALAFRAGARLMDMEQVQLIPFGITHPGAYRGLVCGDPVVAGPAGIIYDNAGRVVLNQGINKLTRAAVVRTMAGAILEGHATKHGGLMLDLRPNLEEGTTYRDKVRATGIFDSVLVSYGRKAFNWEEPWEVIPTAHHFMGGVVADKSGRTSVPGLYAAGEVMGGVHGGNRLGSVALTEIMVFGQLAGRAAAAYAKQAAKPVPVNTALPVTKLLGRKGTYRPSLLCRKLQKTMWDCAGLIREEAQLRSALETIGEMKREAEDVSISAETVYNTEL
ncbi:MAG TPA: FAD-dependent oxidoreductase, partial [Candidatus Limnocylindrales bacterium]|nr:FAD-dependent oxidoreductase [Candidatus Limnocylindrales bacterium]